MRSRPLRAVRLDAADREIVDIVLTIFLENVSASERVLGQIEATIERLRIAPNLGRRGEWTNPALVELRVLPVSRYRQYLIVYGILPDAVEIVAVVNGAQDVQSLMQTRLGEL